MPTFHITDRQSTVASDLSIYGAYAPHFRYRQEQIARAAVIANHRDSYGPTPAFSSLRERLGLALIAVGMRLEGQQALSTATPAPTR